MTGQRLGQHFLKDAAWQQRILRALPEAPDAPWLEIGPGHGEMTRQLAARARRVVAIELDRRLLPGLERLAGELGNVRVVHGDVLAVDLREILAGERFHVYGSLPYYITSPILMRLFAHAERLLSISVVVQMEVAARMAARPGRREYGYLSVVTQFYTQPEIALRLPPGAFQPRPRVASALVRMRLPGERAQLGVGNEAGFLAFVGHCFEQKRKTLLNNLRARHDVARVESALAAAGLKPQARAEELSLTQFARVLQNLAPADLKLHD
jgi:16S rRNA (adenine1518-N6/adenine1519-N6)-dimethyltransferase